MILCRPDLAPRSSHADWLACHPFLPLARLPPHRMAGSPRIWIYSNRTPRPARPPAAGRPSRGGRSPTTCWLPPPSTQLLGHGTPRKHSASPGICLARRAVLLRGAAFLHRDLRWLLGRIVVGRFLWSHNCTNWGRLQRY